jgi:hypothetical protein
VALGLILVTGLALQIAANWIVSKLLVTADNNLRQAVKLFLMTLAGGIGAGVVAALAMTAGRALDLSWLSTVAIIGFALLILYVVFATPMTVYRIGLLRSVFFVLLASVFVSLGQFAAITGFGILLRGTRVGATLRAVTSRDPAIQSTNLAWLRKSVPALAPALDASAVRTASDRTKPLEARRAALQLVRDRLEERRVTLNPKDQAAVAAYKKDAQEYSKWYHEVEEGIRTAAKP